MRSHSSWLAKDLRRRRRKTGSWLVQEDRLGRLRHTGCRTRPWRVSCDHFRQPFGQMHRTCLTTVELCTFSGSSKWTGNRLWNGIRERPPRRSTITTTGGHLEGLRSSCSCAALPRKRSRCTSLSQNGYGPGNDDDVEDEEDVEMSSGFFEVGLLPRRVPRVSRGPLRILGGGPLVAETCSPKGLSFGNSDGDAFSGQEANRSSRCARIASDATTSG